VLVQSDSSLGIEDARPKWKHWNGKQS
jgi:hypothetical protein